MDPIRKPGRFRLAAAMGVVAGLTAGLFGLVAGSSPAGAVPVSLTLNYSCTFPAIGAQPLKVVMNSDMPAEVNVGQPTGEFTINAVTTVNEASRSGLRLVGATTLEGSVAASASLTAPNLSLPSLNVPITIPKQDIPATAGEFTVNANGKTPSLTFQANNVGQAVIKVNNLVLTLTPRDANGNPTGLGTFEAPCTMDAGQNNTMHTFTIKNGTGTTVPTTTPSTTPTTTPTTTPSTTPTTTPPLVFKFDIDGTSHIAAANGDTIIKGNITSTFNLSNNTHSSDLVLTPTTGSFNILGFLPVTANIEFEQVGKTTGSLNFTTGKLTSESKMFVKLTNVLAFGILPIGGGPDCKTIEPATINLATPEGERFDPTTGGNLAGTYTLPGLQADQCGGLGGIISIFMAGPNNTISLKLTKA